MAAARAAAAVQTTTRCALAAALLHAVHATSSPTSAPTPTRYCADGFWPSPVLNGTCVACPTGGVCSGYTVYPTVAAGYWPFVVSADTELSHYLGRTFEVNDIVTTGRDALAGINSRVAFEKCPVSGACLPRPGAAVAAVGEAAVLCKPGYTGHVCTRCSQVPGNQYHRRHDSSCARCPSSGVTALAMIGAYVVQIVIAVLLIAVARAGPRVTTSLMLLFSYCQAISSAFAPEWLSYSRDNFLPQDLGVAMSIFTFPSTYTLIDCVSSDWEQSGVTNTYLYRVAYELSQPLQMVLVFGLIFLPCYIYKQQYRGEGSEWSMGSLHLYFHAYIMYLHLDYVGVTEAALHGFSCTPYADKLLLRASLDFVCEDDHTDRFVLQGVCLVVFAVFSVGLPASTFLIFFKSSSLRRLQEHSKLGLSNVERNHGIYLMRDMHWSHYTLFRQYKPGHGRGRGPEDSRKSSQRGGRYKAEPLSKTLRREVNSLISDVNMAVDEQSSRHRIHTSADANRPAAWCWVEWPFERFWLSIETLWKLCVLLLPHTVSANGPVVTLWSKFLLGTVATFAMLVSQVVMKPYIHSSVRGPCGCDETMNNAAAFMYSVILLLHALAMIYYGLITLDGVPYDDVTAADASSTKFNVLSSIATIATMVGFIYLLTFFVRVCLEYMRLYMEDRQANKLESEFKREVRLSMQEQLKKQREENSGVAADDEELVDRVLIHKLRKIFDTYKRCYAEMARELEREHFGTLPAEPYPETEGWRRVSAVLDVTAYSPEFTTLFSKSETERHFGEMTEINELLEKLEKARELLVSKLSSSGVRARPAGRGGSIGDTWLENEDIAEEDGDVGGGGEELTPVVGANTAESEIEELETLLAQLDCLVQKLDDAWCANDIDSTNNTAVADRLAELLLLELRAMKTAAGEDTYPCLARDNIDHKLKTYLNSKVLAHMRRVQQKLRGHHEKRLHEMHAGKSKRTRQMTDQLSKERARSKTDKLAVNAF